ncbi:hypothetical protein VTI74DRAFT_8992 [Chaetomium olivicolor]
MLPDQLTQRMEPRCARWGVDSQDAQCLPVIPPRLSPGMLKPEGPLEVVGCCCRGFSAAVLACGEIDHSTRSPRKFALALGISSQTARSLSRLGITPELVSHKSTVLYRVLISFSFFLYGGPLWCKSDTERGTPPFLRTTRLHLPELPPLPCSYTSLVRKRWAYGNGAVVWVGSRLRQRRGSPLLRDGLVASYTIPKPGLTLVIMRLAELAFCEHEYGCD